MTYIFLWDEIFQRGGKWAGYGRGPGVTSRCSFLPVGECVCHRRFVHEDSKG